MPETTILDLVQQRTESLVAERLRSVSIAIARLHELIAEANRLGHSHRAIHARLAAAGLETSWNSYRVALVRARRKMRGTAAGAIPGAAAPAAGSTIATALAPLTCEAATAGAGCWLSDASASGLRNASPTCALTALLDARQTAARDYSKVARGLHRKTRP